MPSPILVRKFNKSQLDAITADYRNRINAAGSSISNASIKAIDTFVKGCKQDNIWNLLLDVGVFAGDNLNAALVRLKTISGKSNSYSNSGYALGDYSESTGIQGGLNKYLNTGINPTEVGSNGGLSVYLREGVVAGTSRFFIALQGTDGTAWGIGYLNGGSANSFRWGLVGNEAVVSQPNTSGLYTGYRASSTSIKLFRNAALIAQNLALDNSTPINSNIYIGCRNNGAGGADLFLDKKYSFTCMHLLNTDAQVALLYNRVQALQQGLNRQI